MPTWTPTETWETNDLVTADMMNLQVLGNLEFLKTPPTGLYAPTVQYTTSSSSFVDVDATNLVFTKTLGGGDVLIGFFGSLYHASSSRVSFDIDIDGTRLGNDDGLIGGQVDNLAVPIALLAWKQGLSAASHTFKLQWKVTGGGTATLYGPNASSGYKWHPQFWVREVS